MTLDHVLQIAREMIEEAQLAANHAASGSVRQQILAKRDALTELKLRLQGDHLDRAWVWRVRRLGED